MKIFENQIFDEERALYGEDGVSVRGCVFEGDADGESALKECRNVIAEGCRFALRYPFWHDSGAEISDCKMVETCRAPLWYCTDVSIKNTEMHCPKALRECARVDISHCDIVSQEFGWMSDSVHISDSRASGEYFMLRARGLRAENLDFSGKYSFQYIEDAELDGCNLDTKDAFWHARRVTVRNSVVKGEYLGWYCEDVTFENCRIIGTQPLCYCKGLTLINCTMEACDLSFEKSDVVATVLSDIQSIKNPASGKICAVSAGELILDPASTCEIILTEG